MVKKVIILIKERTVVPAGTQRGKDNQNTKPEIKIKPVIIKKIKSVRPAAREDRMPVASANAHAPKTKGNTLKHLLLDFIGEKKPVIIKVKPKEITGANSPLITETPQPEANIPPVFKPEPAKKGPDHWSDCGQIFYTGGKAFGISSNLRSICIGTQSDVDCFLQYGKLDSGMNFLQKDTLKSIKEIRAIQEQQSQETEKKPLEKANDDGLKLKARGRFSLIKKEPVRAFRTKRKG